MKVSIIIPVFNVAHYIERCVNSVLSQNYSNIEIIIINDATPDNSMDIINNLLLCNIMPKEIKIINHKQNKGLSSARNTGIKNSSGDYLYFLDSDDALTDDNSISHLVNIAEKYNRPDFVIGNMDVFGDPSFMVTFGYRQITCLTTNELVFSHYLKGLWYPMACNKLISRNFINENKLYFYEGIFHEDLLWSFMLARYAKSMAVDTHKTYTYYIRKGSITKSISEKNIEDLIFIYSMVNDNISYYWDNNKSAIVTFMENFRFNILCYISEEIKWIEKYNQLKNIGPKSFIPLRLDVSVKIIVKHILWTLPSSWAYVFYKILLRSINK